MNAFTPISAAFETSPHAGTSHAGHGEGRTLPARDRAFVPGFDPAVAVDGDTWMLHEALARLAEAKDMIEQQQERIAYLESLTMTDELTGLLNRRGFYSHLRRELAAARRNASAGGVMVMIDLDGFKAVNDTHGHVAGDAYLRQVARLLQGRVRAQDVVARLGGDEFAILLTDTDSATGTARATQLGETADRETVEWNGQTLPVRFSLGLHPYAAEDREEDVIRQADVRMYRHKGERRHARRAA